MRQIDFSDTLNDQFNLKTYSKVIIQFLNPNSKPLEFENVLMTAHERKGVVNVSLIDPFSKKLIITVFSELWPSERKKFQANKIILKRFK